MKQNSPKAQLHRLLRIMDFVSRHLALKGDTAETRRFAEIYQQLGLAWEFWRCNAGIAPAGAKCVMASRLARCAV